SKKRHLQSTFVQVSYRLGFSDAFLPFLLNNIISSIYYPNASVIVEAILSCDIVQVLFPFKILPCNFKPLSHVIVQIKRFYRRSPFWNRGAGRGESNSSDAHCQGYYPSYSHCPLNLN